MVFAFLLLYFLPVAIPISFGFIISAFLKKRLKKHYIIIGTLTALCFLAIEAITILYLSLNPIVVYDKEILDKELVANIVDYAQEINLSADNHGSMHLNTITVVIGYKIQAFTHHDGDNIAVVSCICFPAGENHFSIGLSKDYKEIRVR